MSSHRIGLLALQGDYEAHGKALVRAGFPRCGMVERRSSSDLQFLTAIIIPGGESSVMSMLLERFGIFEELKRQIENGMPVLATCAGLILLAKNIEGNDQMGLGVLDIKVKRNAYGRQVDSFHAPVQTIIDSVGIIEGIFIRAPRILASGKEVEHLAIYENEPVMVRQGSIIAATFHPELLPDAPVHRWFIQTFV